MYFMLIMYIYIFFLVLIMYFCTNVCMINKQYIYINILPDVISELFITNDTFHSHNTRNKNELRPKLSNREYMYKNFSFIGVYIWNNIQDHILINTSHAAFKSNTKNYFQYNNIIYRVT